MLAFILLLLFDLAAGQAADGRVTVQTGNGNVIGDRLGLLGRRFNRFLGIPFAKPPTGELRFKPPESVDDWDTVEALEMPPGCPQRNNSLARNISEDCLYLNIWAPDGATDNAVMIWIYGGSFDVGSTALYDGTMFAAYSQVVFVAINYRVNIFGFLRLSEDEAPGNVGLLDQYMAIQWVHDNIQWFGGDPGRMTVFGESAGAFSTLLHTMTPLPRLFQNVAVQSAYGVTSRWEISTAAEAAGQGRRYAALLGCGDGDDSHMAACLRKLPWQNITRGVTGQTTDVPLVTVDGRFLEAFPSPNILEFTRNLSVIIGTNENEGMFLLQVVFPGKFLQQQKPDISDAEIQTALQYLAGITDSRTVDYLHELYSEFEDNLYRVDAMLGDFFFMCPTIRYARGFAEGSSNKVFMYRMNHATSGRSEPAWTGANHALEISHVFGAPIARALYPYYTEEETALSEQMISYWTNLAKYRTPNSWNTEVPWPEYTEEYENYLIFDIESQGGISVDSFLRQEQCRFWDNIYPGLIQGRNLTDLLRDYGMDDGTSSSATALPVLTSLVVSASLLLGSFWCRIQ